VNIVRTIRAICVINTASSMGDDLLRYREDPANKVTKRATTAVSIVRLTMAEEEIIAEEVDRRERIAPTVKELYRMGLPLINFMKVVSKSSKHTSNHRAIDTSQEKPFNILDEFSADADLGTAFLNPSCILNEPGIKLLRSVEFSSEADIQHLVRNMLSDIIQLLDEGTKLRILGECSVAEAEGAAQRRQRVDFWVVYRDGRPVLLVEVKSPADGNVNEDDNGDILEDKGVLGQVYDYLKILQEFHGAMDVFAVLTTLKHWKIVWLPVADNMAAATTLTQGFTKPDPAELDIAGDAEDADAAPAPPAEPAQHAHDGQIEEAPGDVPEPSRAVSFSQTYPQTAAELPRVLMSALKKAQNTRFKAVPFLAHRRLYIKLWDSKWEWVQLPEARVTVLKERLTLALRNAPNPDAWYLIVRYLDTVGKLKVWLTLVASHQHAGTLCVVKQCANAAAAEQEAEYWRTVNDSPHAATRKVCGMSAVVTPFVVLAEDRGGQVSFQFEPNKWLVQPCATAGDVPVSLLAAAAMMRTFAEQAGVLTPRAAAEQAIARMAALGRCHDDLAWRHVALVPVFDAGERLCGVRPGLIDFGRVRAQVTPTAAQAEMKAQLDKICKNRIQV
jgi:hypothetical protein